MGPEAPLCCLGAEPALRRALSSPLAPDLSLGIKGLVGAWVGVTHSGPGPALWNQALWGSATTCSPSPGQAAGSRWVKGPHNGSTSWEVCILSKPLHSS